MRKDSIFKKLPVKSLVLSILTLEENQSYFLLVIYQATGMTKYHLLRLRAIAQLLFMITTILMVKAEPLMAMLIPYMILILMTESLLLKLISVGLPLTNILDSGEIQLILTLITCPMVGMMKYLPLGLRAIVKSLSFNTPIMGEVPNRFSMMSVT